VRGFGFDWEGSGDGVEEGNVFALGMRSRSAIRDVIVEMDIGLMLRIRKVPVKELVKETELERFGEDIGIDEEAYLVLRSHFYVYIEPRWHTHQANS